MPSPNAAKKSPHSKTPETQGKELGQRLARRKSQNFNAKISGWVQGGGGVAQGDDEIVVIEENDGGEETVEAGGAVAVEGESSAGSGESVEPDAMNAKAPAKHSPKSREIDHSRKAWVRRKSKPNAAEVSPDVKQAVTPKKRVVSDGHWRRDRATPAKKDGSSPEHEKEKDKDKDITPKPVTVRRSVVNVGLRVPPCWQDFVEDEEQPVRRRPITSRSWSRSEVRDDDEERTGTPDYENSGVKVYVKRRRRSKTHDDGPRKMLSKSESSFTEHDKSLTTELTTPDAAPSRGDLLRPSTAPKERVSASALDDYARGGKVKQMSLEAEDVTQRAHRKKSGLALNYGKDAPRPSNAAHAYDGTFKHEKPQSEKAPPRPVPKQFGNRIEGWLNAMPDDPFTESKETSLAPQPLDVSRKKKSRHSGDNPQDSHGEESDGQRRKGSGRRRRSKPSIETLETLDQSRPSSATRTSMDDWSEHSISATPTLKRSGAKRNMHSPSKDRVMRSSSQSDEGNREPMVSRNHSRRKTLHGSPVGATVGNRLSTIDSVETFRSPPVGGRVRAGSAGSEQPTIIPDGSVLSDGDNPAANGGGLKRRLTKHSDLISVLSLPKENDRALVPARSVRTRRQKQDAVQIGDIMNELTADELKYQRELRTLVDGVIPVLLTHVISNDNTSSAYGNPTSTAPIVEMGVALEKLKTKHRHISMHSPDELLKWARSSTKLYRQYLAAWRLGFSDVVVNLAPAEQTKDGAWDEGLQRNAKGDLLDGNGERVDVAYLLKRPLVRLKYLTKTFRGINEVEPSASAEDMAAQFHELVQEARQRANDERARLEDEAASAIDSTRARDPRSLAPLAGVSIDPTRSVRARDYFDMELFHTTGQQLDCTIEIIMRDDAPNRGSSGDLLFCEVSTTGRWLLFPPALARFVSARKGGREGEIIVMIRGMLSNGSEWREIMSLRSDDEQCAEWLGMLSADPMPPRLSRQSSFNTMRGHPQRHAPSSSYTESELPIGERARDSAPQWDGSDVNSIMSSEYTSPNLRRSGATKHRRMPSSQDLSQDPWSEDQSETTQGAYPDEPRHAGRSRYERPNYGHSRSKTETSVATSTSTTSTKKDYSVWLPSETHTPDHSSDEDDEDDQDLIASKRPNLHRRTSSVPEKDLPTANKLRKTSQPITPTKDERPHRSKRHSTSPEDPTSAPAKLQKRPPGMSKEEHQEKTRSATQTKPSSFGGLKSSVLPVITPAFMKKDRRSSSPLKHEYEPSTATESSSESDLSDYSETESMTSESLPDEDVVSTIGELKDFSNMHDMRPHQPRSTYSRDDTVGPSESASQAPYRTVPQSQQASAKSVAGIFCWAPTGSWDSLHPEECEIVVSPGLIEAFDLAQAHAVSPNSGDAMEPSPSARGVRPLVALELTPLVPLRRGTAVDISIRSPPTANSVISRGPNMMFRSGSPAECEQLYALINRARIENPTYIALQNARGPTATSNWAELMDRRNAERSNGNPSWLKSLSRRSSTYRSKGTRSASVSASQSSVGTATSAFSALRRFGGSRIFNIAKSTITSREGTRSTASDSLDSGQATPVNQFDARMGTPLGVSNAKIRLYLRESASKWNDKGSARLTILHPPRPPGDAPADPDAPGGKQKRVLIHGKSKGETLLDVTLGEESFERVARTGIAISVVEEGEVAATGGVVTSRARVFMLQMKSEREAAYTFSMVGKLRY